MTSDEWKKRAQLHRFNATELRAEAEKLLNTAKSEDIAAKACEINANREQ